MESKIPKECPICLCDESKGLQNLTCGHYIHKKCSSGLEKAICPICSAVITIFTKKEMNKIESNKKKYEKQRIEEETRELQREENERNIRIERRQRNPIIGLPLMSNFGPCFCPNCMAQRSLEYAYKQEERDLMTAKLISIAEMISVEENLRDGEYFNNFSDPLLEEFSVNSNEEKQEQDIEHKKNNIYFNPETYKKAHESGLIEFLSKFK